MHELIDFFQANAALVIANPVAFATFAGLFGTGGFVIGRYFLTERIANLESRIARRDDEIETLKKHKGRNSEPSLIPIIGTSAVGPTEPTQRLGKWPDRQKPRKLSGPPRQRHG
jgi:hypothetical protein